MDIDGLTAEHLQYCHPVLPVLVKKLLLCEEAVKLRRVLQTLCGEFERCSRVRL